VALLFILRGFVRVKGGIGTGINGTWKMQEARAYSTEGFRERHCSL
jgi:hypothetical protein